MKNLPTKEELIAFEDRMAAQFKNISGPIHLSHGNENQLIEIFKEVSEEDWVCSSHRNHYHALLKGIPQHWLEKQILEGLSMTTISEEYRFFSSGIMGDAAPIALGIALGVKLAGSSEKVWCFVGDMASEMGSFHESLKYAERHDLPITFVVEDNDLSVVTPTRETWGLLHGADKVRRYEYKNIKYPHAGVGKAYAGF